MGRIRKQLEKQEESERDYQSLNVQERWNLLATVANLYYNSKMTQKEIADRFYTSRSRVSRMLDEARELGVVEIHIREPWERNFEYEEKLKTAFSLRDVRVVTHSGGHEKNLQRIAEAAAYCLDCDIQKNMVIGVSWGNTLYHIVQRIAEQDHKNFPVMFVPIMGASNIPCPGKDAVDLARELATAYGGTYNYLCAPLFVENADLRQNLIRESAVSSTLSLARNADIMLTSLGIVDNTNWHYAINRQMISELKALNAVGHIGGHFYDIEGKPVSEKIESRIIGISLSDLKDCPNVICPVCGEEKATAVLGALNGGYLNVLVIDELCAKRVLQLT